MSLISSLHNAAASLGVFSRAIDIEGSNVANAATPGYAAVRSSIQPIGTGATVIGSDYIIQSSAGNFHADARVQAATSDAAWSQNKASSLAPVNQLFDITGGSGLLAAFQQFGAAFAGLAVNPNDQALRSTALSAAGAVATEFRRTAAGIDAQTIQVDSTIQGVATQINGLADQIRQYNVQLRGTDPPDPGVEANRRAALEDLASLTDITTTVNPDGSVAVLTGAQQPLVLGDQAYKLTVSPSAAPGAQVSSSGGGNSPGTYSGKLGALLDVRNNTLASLLGGGSSAGSLNTLAKGFATRVNSLFSSSVLPSGAAGVPIYTFDIGNDQNVARTLALDPAVTPSQLALGSTGPSAQSNGTANALSGLFNSSNPADWVNGATLQKAFSGLASGVGQQLSDATHAASSSLGTLTSAVAERQQISGISLDKEAVNITSLQRYFEANAKLVGILDTLTQTEIGLIR